MANHADPAGFPADPSRNKQEGVPEPLKIWTSNPHLALSLEPGNTGPGTWFLKIAHDERPGWGRSFMLHSQEMPELIAALIQVVARYGRPRQQKHAVELVRKALDELEKTLEWQGRAAE